MPPNFVMRSARPTIRGMDALLLTLAVAGAAVVVLVLTSLRRVPDGQSFTVNRLGQYHRTLGPGRHLVLPLIDRITHRISILGQMLQVECPPLKTRDDHPVLARGAIYFQVLDPRKAAYHRRSVQDAAQDLAQSTTRELVQQMTLDALSSRSGRELNTWLLGMLNRTSTEWGVRVTRIDLRFSEHQGPSED